jgi:hypothetical protein
MILIRKTKVRGVKELPQHRNESDKRARVVHKRPKPKMPTLGELDARLAATRDRRIKSAEKNGVNLIGRTRL